MKHWPYEGRNEPLLSRNRFLLRLAGHTIVALSFVALALLVGMLGYHFTERMGWLDAFLNASMILSGMGPAADLHTDVGKFFAGTYAIFSGIVFLLIVGAMMAPVAHRILHRFHLSVDNVE